MSPKYSIATLLSASWYRTKVPNEPLVLHPHPTSASSYRAKVPKKSSLSVLLFCTCIYKKQRESLVITCSRST